MSVEALTVALPLRAKLVPGREIIAFLLTSFTSIDLFDCCL